MDHIKTVKGYSYAILSAIIFGCMPLMAKFIYADGVNSLTLVLLRNALSLPVLGVLAFIQKRTFRIPVKALPQISIISAMGNCITPLLLFSSYNFIASGTATVFHFIYPAMVVLGSLIFLREKPKIGNLISVVICAVGICLFYTPGQPLDYRGGVLALLSGVTYSVYVILLSGFKYKEISGFTFCFYNSAITTVFLFVISIVSGQLMLPNSAFGWIFSFFFSVVINVGAVALFQHGVFLIGGQRASILSTIEPTISVIVGILVFDEKVGIRVAIGVVLVILASILIALSDMRRTKKDKPE